MNMNIHRAATIGLVCGSAVALALAGCATYDQPSRSSGAYYAAPEQGNSAYVEIRTEGDFYEPLSPYGRWEIVGSYGRCWIPERVGADWGPYEDGYWRLTDDGWYWESTEPWGWATYHYGRWDSDPRYGWFWVPQTRWGPAWVSWRHGGGYTGWAPMGPTGRAVERHDRRNSHDGGYVFVEDRQFLEPVRHRTVAVNATVINRTVVDARPSTTVIEKASGRKVQAAPAHDLRRNAEAAANSKHAQPEASGAKKEAVRNDAPQRNVTPKTESRSRPAAMRAPEHESVQPVPAAGKPQAKAGRAPGPRTKPAVKAAPAPVVGPPAPRAEEPGKRKGGKDNEREEPAEHGAGNDGRP